MREVRVINDVSGNSFYHFRETPTIKNMNRYV